MTDSSGPLNPIPALLTRMSRRPKRSRARPTTRSLTPAPETSAASTSTGAPERHRDHRRGRRQAPAVARHEQLGRPGGGEDAGDGQAQPPVAAGHHRHPPVQREGAGPRSRSPFAHHATPFAHDATPFAHDATRSSLPARRLAAPGGLPTIRLNARLKAASDW